MFRRRRREAPQDLKIRIPYEDSDDSVFNCVGVHRGRQFMAFVTGASPWDPETQTTCFSPSEPGWEERKRWYGVIHLFDPDDRARVAVRRPSPVSVSAGGR